jgi:hypothetical protein
MLLFNAIPIEGERTRCSGSHETTKESYQGPREQETKVVFVTNFGRIRDRFERSFLCVL